MLDAAENIKLVSFAMAGLLLGAFYFGGLWWTVRRMLCVRRPSYLYFGSLIVRLGAVLAAFYALLINYAWPILVASLVGFVVARIALVRSLRHSSTADLPVETSI